MTTAKSQAVQLLVSREVTPGTAPTTLWRTLQPNPSGIQGFAPQHIDVARNVLSPNMTDEKGDHVGQNAAWTLVHDVTKDLFDYFGAGLLRSQPKVPGDEPTTQIYYPTAFVDGGVSADEIAVPADGDLTDGHLVRTRGARNAANNSVFVLAGTSTTTAIKVATGTFVAETVTPAGSVEAEVCGHQFAAGDAEINASGNFATASFDCTTLNLVDGQEVWFGGVATATKFATSANNGRAFVNGTVTTNEVPLKWHSFTPVASATDDDAKTIQIFFGVCYRNVADGHADYIEEPVWHFEKRDTGVGTAGAAVYVYSERTAINSIALAMGVEQKIEATLSFLGCKITKPVLAADRKAGPSTATPSVSTELFDTTSGAGGGDMPLHRIVAAADGSALIAMVNSATLTIAHGAQVQKQLAAADGPINFGKIRPSVTMETFYENYAVPLAIDANTSCRYEAVIKNASGAISITLPGGVLSGGTPTYGEDSPVMMGVNFTAHRDPVSNMVAIVNVFPYLPRSTVQA